MDYITGVENRGNKLIVKMRGGETFELHAQQLQYISVVHIDDKGNIYERKAVNVVVTKDKVTLVRVNGTEITEIELKEGEQVTIDLMHAARKV